MQIYKDIIKDVMENGTLVENRTGVKTISCFGRQYRYNLKEGFPILTTRYQPFKKIAGELLWFISGDKNCDYLDEQDIKIWKQWTNPESNSIGPAYGYKWRHWPSSREPGTEIDQLQLVIDNIRNNPFSRRHVITAWDPAYLPDESISPIDNVALGNTALAECHILLNFSVRKLPLTESLLHTYNIEVLEQICKDLVSEGKIVLEKYMKEGHINTEDACCVDSCAKLVRDYIRDNPEEDFSQYDIKRNALSLNLYQRSWDIGAAGGWNVSQYALLLCLVAHVTGLIPYEFIHSIGDIHIYKDQIPGLMEQIQREGYPLPTLLLNPDIKEIDDFTINYIDLKDYRYHSKIVIPVAT